MANYPINQLEYHAEIRTQLRAWMDHRELPYEDIEINTCHASLQRCVVTTGIDRRDALDLTEVSQSEEKADDSLPCDFCEDGCEDWICVPVPDSSPILPELRFLRWSCDVWYEEGPLDKYSDFFDPEDERTVSWNLDEVWPRDLELLYRQAVREASELVRAWVQQDIETNGLQKEY